MGKQTDIIVNENIEDCPDGEIGSRVTMRKAKRVFPDKYLRVENRFYRRFAENSQYDKDTRRCLTSPTWCNVVKARCDLRHD